MCFSVEFNSGEITINADANADLITAYKRNLLEINDLDSLIMKS